MGKLKKLTEKFFKPKLEKAGGNGLYATLEELTEQRRFVPILRTASLTILFRLVPAM